MVYDPYAPTHGRGFDVVRPEGGGLIFVALDDGSVLNPLGLNRSLVVDAVVNQSTFYKKVKQTLQEEIRQKKALDAKVAEILNSEPFVSQRRQREADMALFKNAMKYVQHLNHQYWSIKGDVFQSLTPEPDPGCSKCKTDYEKWITGVHEDRLRPAKDELERNYRLLGSTHERYMARIRRGRDHKPTIAMRAGGYTEELPP